MLNCAVPIAHWSTISTIIGLLLFPCSILPHAWTTLDLGVASTRASNAGTSSPSVAYAYVARSTSLASDSFSSCGFIPPMYSADSTSSASFNISQWARLSLRTITLRPSATRSRIIRISTVFHSRSSHSLLATLAMAYLFCMFILNLQGT